MPDLKFVELILDSLAISLFINAISDISRVKKPTGILFFIAIFAAIVSASAVFPIEGLAPIIINSEF